MKVCFDSSFGKSIDKIKGNSILNHLGVLLVCMRIFFQRTFKSSLFVLCSCRPIKPLAVMVSDMSAMGIPLIQVLMELPMASILNLFHSPGPKAERTATVSVSVSSHWRRRASSQILPLKPRSVGFSIVPP